MFGGLFRRSAPAAPKAPRVERAPEPQSDPGERVYAIGDIHGRFDLLKGIVAKIVEDAEARKDHRATRIIFLGDYIDRGDQSCDVLDFLTRMSEITTSDITFLRGNHEDAMLRFLDDPTNGKQWLKWGGQQTMASYGITPASPRATDEELEQAAHKLRLKVADHLPFLRNLDTFTISGDVIFSHAGLKPGVPVEQQDEDHMVWGHPGFPEKNPALPGKRVIHGHFDNATVINMPGRLCIDTGAYYSGRLTAVCLDADERLLST